MYYTLAEYFNVCNISIVPPPNQKQLEKVYQTLTVLKKK